MLCELQHDLISCSFAKDARQGIAERDRLLAEKAELAAKKAFGRFCFGSSFSLL